MMDEYPDRASLIGSMGPMLKAARRPIDPEWQQFGLDGAGWQILDRLTDLLVRHVYFEHLGREGIRESLRGAMVSYRSLRQSDRPKAKIFAQQTLDAMAREPLRKTVYLGVEHLQLPHGTVVGDVRFLEPSQDPRLVTSFAYLSTGAPSLLCEVPVIAGTVDLLRDRARDKAGTALGLVRQQNLFGFAAKIYLEQVLYGLDGTWAWGDDSGITRAGWWREKLRPLPMDLTHPTGADWRAELAEVADLYSQIPPGLRLRVDTCIDWLDVAALSNRWRIIIPAIFTGMEALLVPEKVGLKAALVTVRSVAVHLALGHGFFHPDEIMAGYRLRSVLTHGAPTSDVLNIEATNFAEFRRHWGFLVLCDYRELATEISAGNVQDVVAYLDDGKCNDVCNWLDENDGSEVVGEYRKISHTRQSRSGSTEPTQ